MRRIRGRRVNKNGQQLVRKTGAVGNHPFSRRWVLHCTLCSHEYGANGCDFHLRKCPKPKCQGGRKGLLVPAMATRS